MTDELRELVDKWREKYVVDIRAGNRGGGEQAARAIELCANDLEALLNTAAEASESE